MRRCPALLVSALLIVTACAGSESSVAVPASPHPVTVASISAATSVVATTTAAAATTSSESPTTTVATTTMPSESLKWAKTRRSVG